MHHSMPVELTLPQRRDQIELRLLPAASSLFAKCGYSNPDCGDQREDDKEFRTLLGDLAAANDLSRNPGVAFVISMSRGEIPAG